MPRPAVYAENPAAAEGPQPNRPPRPRREGDLPAHREAGTEAEVVRLAGMPEPTDGEAGRDPVADPGRGEAAPGPGTDVVVLGADEHRVTAQAEAILAAAASGLYQRGQQLVQVLSQGPVKGRQCVCRAPSAPVIRRLPPAILREELSRHVRFVKLSGDRMVRIHVPGFVVSAVHERGVWQGLPRLEGVVNHPVLFEDGTVLAEPGYHPDSGLLLWLPGGLEVSVPEAPTHPDAVRARDVLLDVVSEFPFKEPAHGSAFLAALLTPLARFAFEGPAPLFIADGNTPGCGKGLLLDVIFLAVCGRRASVMGYTNDQEELRKAVTAVAVGGDEMVLLDNVAGAFGNAVLDRALTATHWKDRILGGNSLYDGPLTVTWYATANNVTVVGDTPRHLLPVRLESPDERPEERGGFRYPDLRQHVLAHRGRLLSAALTILRAYILAGRPQRPPLKSWGSYEGWSALVRGAVAWVLLPDPGEARADLPAASCPEAEAWDSVYAGVAYLDPAGQGVTVAAIVEAANSPGTDPTLQALKDALLHLCPPRDKAGVLNAQSVGPKLNQYRGRVVGGRRLERLATKSHATAPRWRVIEVGGLRGV
jgi:hypothetical protein